MDFLRKMGAPAPTTRARGRQAEDLALRYALAQGWQLLERNYRTPGRGGGEIDLIVRTRDGTVVFVEVRSRNTARFGGAGGSIGPSKQRRIILAARHWLAAQRVQPPCRFDAALVEGEQLQWLQAAFSAG